MTIIVLGLLSAFGISLIVFAMSLSREKGALGERLKRLEEQAEVDKKRAEIIAQPRTDDETINRLDDGTF